MAANRARHQCGVCADTFQRGMIQSAQRRQHAASPGARVIGEGLALDIADAFLAAQFEGGRHATRVDMIVALETIDRCDGFATAAVPGKCLERLPAF